MPHDPRTHALIHYESEGEATKGTIVLIAGLGMQLTSWTPQFRHHLVAAGYRVIAVDNRDAGLSPGIGQGMDRDTDDAGIPDLAAIIAARRAGTKPPVPYTLSDMAADIAGLVTALDLGKVHVAGASMGGMIAQLLALEHPGTVTSLVSIMSTTGDPALPRATREAQAMLTAKRTSPEVDRERYLDEAVASSTLFGGTCWPMPPEMLRARATQALERAYRPDGFLRQYAAIAAAADRSGRLKDLKVPAAVIHGTQDPLIPLEAGQATAAAIPGCEMVAIDGMGHSIPPALEKQIAAVIIRTTERRA